MTFTDIAGPLKSVGLPILAVAVIAYVLIRPNEAKIIAGWILTGLSAIFRHFDRAAVATRLEGEINKGTNELLRGAPSDIVQGELSIRWADAEQAEARLREGEVVVFMKRARDHEDNITRAIMAYLPQAVIPRGRRYVNRTRMRASDLTLAKSILAQDGRPRGALNVFFEDHLDPALENEPDLASMLKEVDAIDLHGWLVRILLVEYRELGDLLHPGDCDDECLQDAEDFAKWLFELAEREPGSEIVPLSYRGKYIRVGVIFVAIKDRLETQGLAPYLKRARAYLSQKKVDRLYLMARDQNISSVKDLSAALKTEPFVEEIETFTYRLRRDFRARKLNREKAILVAVRGRRSWQPTLAADSLDKGVSKRL